MKRTCIICKKSPDQLDASGLYLKCIEYKMIYYRQASRKINITSDSENLPLPD